ncbi:MAG: type II toxin-antitoxin system RelE/ParE family toxin [Bacteroidales bacterium]|nr:type II toxin-antitoxin system RelE/ParE family toxin [Bacteroidales bacterium]
MKLKISPFAEEDLEESIEYYNIRKQGLGYEFARTVSDTFDRIKENPLQFPYEYKEMRKAQIDKFPFNIYFVIKNPVGYILGIFHSSRNPLKMRVRYKNFD